MPRKNTCSLVVSAMLNIPKKAPTTKPRLAMKYK